MTPSSTGTTTSTPTTTPTHTATQTPTQKPNVPPNCTGAVLALRLDTGATNSVGVLSSLHFDEVYGTCAGGLRQPFAISTATAGRYCTLTAGNGGWTYDHDGFPANSENRNLAFTVCYNEAPGTTVSLLGPYGVDVGKTIAVMDWTGAITFSAPILGFATGGSAFESGIRQAATVDGTAYWVVGEATGGAYGYVYIPSLTSPTPLVQLSGKTPAQPGWFDARAVVTYRGALYGVDSVEDIGWGGVFTIGSGLPAVASNPAAVLLPGFSGTASLWTIVFQSPTIIWAAIDSGTYGTSLGSVVSFTLSAGNWAQSTAIIVDAFNAVYSLAGRFEGANFVLFTSTATTVYRIDTTVGNPCSIYSAPSGSVFRGVALSPCSPSTSSTPTPSSTS